ncbi:ankyrin repeat-containing domain protein [Baffinella frigidus]|nr:ankyrin repeat-containing domain protein [Cryptophyta sp. CCMP2293]
MPKGANVGSVDRQVYNQTALHAACESGNGHVDVIEELNGHVDVIEELVKSGADINARSINNSTALHEAAYWAHAGAVRTLLDLGADPFLENTNGHTPLLQAEGNWQAAEGNWQAV